MEDSRTASVGRKRAREESEESEYIPVDAEEGECNGTPPSKRTRSSLLLPKASTGMDRPEHTSISEGIQKGHAAQSERDERRKDGRREKRKQKKRAQRQAKKQKTAATLHACPKLSAAASEDSWTHSLEIASSPRSIDTRPLLEALYPNWQGHVVVDKEDGERNEKYVRVRFASYHSAALAKSRIEEILSRYSRTAMVTLNCKTGVQRGEEPTLREQVENRRIWLELAAKQARKKLRLSAPKAENIMVHEKNIIVKFVAANPNASIENRCHSRERAVAIFLLARPSVLEDVTDIFLQRRGGKGGPTMIAVLACTGPAVAKTTLSRLRECQVDGDKLLDSLFTLSKCDVITETTCPSREFAKASRTYDGGSLHDFKWHVCPSVDHLVSYVRSIASHALHGSVAADANAADIWDDYVVAPGATLELNDDQEAETPSEEGNVEDATLSNLKEAISGHEHVTLVDDFSAAGSESDKRLLQQNNHLDAEQRLSGTHVAERKSGLYGHSTTNEEYEASQAIDSQFATNHQNSAALILNEPSTGCSRCKSVNHFESLCTSLWRTFHPKQSHNVSQAREYLSGCYNCGSSSHWGDDCPSKNRSDVIHSETFSEKAARPFLSHRRDYRRYDMSNLQNSDAESTQRSYAIQSSAHPVEGSAWTAVNGTEDHSNYSRGLDRDYTSRDYAVSYDNPPTSRAKPSIAQASARWAAKKAHEATWANGGLM